MGVIPLYTDSQINPTKTLKNKIKTTTRHQDQLEKVWEKKSFSIPRKIQIFLKTSYSELGWNFTYFKYRKTSLFKSKIAKRTFHNEWICFNNFHFNATINAEITFLFAWPCNRSIWKILCLPTNISHWKYHSIFPDLHRKLDTCFSKTFLTIAQ